MSVGLAAAAPATAGNVSSQPFTALSNLPPAAQTPGAGYAGTDQLWQSSASAPSQPYASAATPVLTSKHQQKNHTPLYASIAAATTAAVTLVLWLFVRKRGTKGNSKVNTSFSKTATAETAQNIPPVQAGKHNEIKEKQGVKAGEKAASVPAERTPLKAPKPESQIQVSKPLGGDTRISAPSRWRLPRTLFSPRIKAGLAILTLMGAAYFKRDGLRAGLKLAGSTAMAMGPKAAYHIEEAIEECTLARKWAPVIATPPLIYFSWPILKEFWFAGNRVVQPEGESSATEASVSGETNSTETGSRNGEPPNSDHTPPEVDRVRR